MLCFQEDNTPLTPQKSITSHFDPFGQNPERNSAKRQFVVAVRKRDILQKFVVTGPPLSTTRKQRQNQSTYFVEDTLDNQNEPSEYSLFTVNNYVHGKGTDSNLFTVNVLIN